MSAHRTTCRVVIAESRPTPCPWPESNRLDHQSENGAASRYRGSGACGPGGRASRWDDSLTPRRATRTTGSGRPPGALHSPRWKRIMAQALCVTESERSHVAPGRPEIFTLLSCAAPVRSGTQDSQTLTCVNCNLADRTGGASGVPPSLLPGPRNQAKPLRSSCRTSVVPAPVSLADPWARRRAGSGRESNPLAIALEVRFPTTEAAKPATDQIRNLVITGEDFRSALRLAEDNSTTSRRGVNELFCDLGHNLVRSCGVWR